MEQNYPNHFNPETEIRYGIPKKTRLTIRIYNISGQLVTTLHDGLPVAGNDIVRWNGLNSKGARVSSGIYFYELADNCQYWIGECYYAMGRYYEAIAEFQKVYAFAKSNKALDAQLMIGVAFLKNGEKDMARAELNIVLSFDLRSASAKKAQRYLRMIDNA